MLDPAAKLMRGLTEALALESLSQEPSHGYAIMKELEEVFGEPPNRNRIYPLLSRLEEEGYIEGIEDPDSSRGKTVYSLTEAGEARLAEYRAMPAPFRETLERFWGAGGGGGAPEGSGEPGDEGDSPPDDGAEGPPDADDAPEQAEAEREARPDQEATTAGEGPDDDDGGDGEPGGGGGSPGGGGEGGGGMDLRRNPETGEVEMVIRGTHWGEVRIELGEIRDD